MAGGARLPVGASTVFPLPGSDEQGFVLSTATGPRAFRNRCRHWPVPLDMDDGDFWSPDLGVVVCKTHGALFRGDDGLCVLGPCAGASLESWPVRVDGDDVVVELG